MMRVIVAGVGYRNLRDHSVGPAVVDRLLARDWAGDVVVEDLSYNPIAVVQRLEDEPPGRRFARAVVVAGVERGRTPATITAYRWDGVLPAEEDIQRAVAEAVTGVIALDNTLIVARHFGALPDEVVVVEVEPAVHEFGETFSDDVAAVFDAACEVVVTLATDPAAVARLPRAPLGGGRPEACRSERRSGAGFARATILGEASEGAVEAPSDEKEERDVLEEAQRLIAALESHADPGVRADVAALLQTIDAVHRSALTHLVNAIRGMAGDAFLNRLSTDPAIRLLLMSYDLLAVDRRLLAEEALDAVRGHLHTHGIDVELADVVGGAVYVRVHGLGGSAISLEAVRHDLEEALRGGLVGFQELVLGDRPAAGPPLIQVGGLRPAQRPVYRRACAVAEVAPGGVRAVDVDGQPILVANVDGDLYAVANRCGDSPLPLHFGTLEGSELRCSWHGCRYDVRTGHRRDGGPERLTVFPVAVEGDEVRVAVGVEPVARG